MRREFLQLADHYKPAKHDITGWLLSEKLDGTRCFWDGGLSRGMRTEDVPWASIIDPKTGERKAKIKPVSTGLWSRYGNPIIAPDSFLNQLPCCPLDGELWAGRGKFQLCRSICSGDTPDPRFDCIEYAVYSSPSLSALFATGEIKNANMVRAIDFIAIEHWIRNRLESFDGDFRYLPPGSIFQDELHFLSKNLDNGLSCCYMHRQEKLPSDLGKACVRIAEFLDHALEQGGEGIVLRDQTSTWTPRRHKGILKWKPFEDAEGTITGFTSGRETDKGSRLLGKIGSLIVDYDGKRLKVAGLTDKEREFEVPEMLAWAAKNPDADMPAYFQGKHFRVGQTVTFKYRELTDDGIPKEARYWRKRDVE
jgi:DNA ligase-1